MKTWIFLSTHFDDVALSAGGMVWELTAGVTGVEIWTIAAGEPAAWAAAQRLCNAAAWHVATGG